MRLGKGSQDGVLAVLKPSLVFHAGQKSSRNYVGERHLRFFASAGIWPGEEELESRRKNFWRIVKCHSKEREEKFSVGRASPRPKARAARAAGGGEAEE